MNLLAELKRRNVIRMAGVYLVGAWLLTQVAATLLPVFEAPAWVMKTVVGVLAAGFIPALIFAWVFELTPQGLKRDAEVSPQQSIGSQTARKMEHIIVVLFAIALLFFGVDKFYLAPKREAALVANTLQSAKAAIAISDKSIAVLPFVDMSQAKDQEWFGDGLADEILNALVKTPDLQVSARTSSFRYKGSNLGVPQIARELGVANVLEGSIRSTAQRIRVTAQLIRATDGFHLWSQTYDRDPADIITIQEDLALQIATALQTNMDPAALADMASVGTKSIEAYQAYIRGVAMNQQLDLVSYSKANQYFEQATEHDPSFAAAHVRVAAYWLQMLQPVGMVTLLNHVDAQKVMANFNEHINAAIRHATNETDRIGYRAIQAKRSMRLREAIELYSSLLAYRPSDSVAITQLIELVTKASEMSELERLLDLAWPLAQTRAELASVHINYSHRTQDKAKAADQALQLAERWPSATIFYQAHRALLWNNRVDAARDMLARFEGQATDGNALIPLSVPRARQACAEGRRDDAERLLAAETESISRWHLLMLLGQHAEANAIVKSLEHEGDAFSLSGFLTYPDFDPTQFPALMAVLEREKVKRPPPVLMPYACPPAGRSK